MKQTFQLKHLFNKTFWKRFTRFSLVALSLVVIALTVNFAVTSRGIRPAFAVEKGECVDGWTFLGGDAGSDDAWSFGCSNGGGQPTQGSSQGPTQGSAPAPAPQCNPVWESRNPECDWNAHQQYEVQQNSCTGEYRRFNYETVAGQCGAPVPQPVQPAPQPQGPSCTPSDKIGVENRCVGNQLCQVNKWQDASCNTGFGGTYNCQNVNGQCGYNTPSTPTTTVTTTSNPQVFVCDNTKWRLSGDQNASGKPTCEVNNKDRFGGCINGGATVGGTCETAVACYVCDSGNWRQAGGTYTTDSCRSAGYSTDSNRPASCTTPAQPVNTSQTVYVCDNTGFSDGQGRWRVSGDQNNAGKTTCIANNSSTFAGCIGGGATAGAICEAKSQPVAQTPVTQTPVVVQPAQGSIRVAQAQDQSQANVQSQSQTATGGNANANASTGSVNVSVNSSNYNNVNNNITTPTTTNTIREVREVIRYADAKNTTTTTTATKTAVASDVKELPKTGLPIAAWLLAGALPVGIKLRRFGRSFKDSAVSANSLWENRQFKKD